jgi:hypothetical protein
MKTIGIGALTGDLFVCNTGTGITATDCDATLATAKTKRLTDNAIAVIYSLGKNAPEGSTSTDEAPNIANHQTFVSAPTGPNFDDSIIWISPNIVVGRLVAAGRLP